MTDEDAVDTVDDTTTDVVTAVASRYATAKLETPYFNGSMYDRPAQDFGVAVHLDGTSISLASGTIHDDDDDQMYVYCGLSPDEARHIGNTLIEVADTVDERLEAVEDSDNSTEPDETKSFLRRLIG